MPATFYGIALLRYLPGLVVAAIGLGLLGLALLVRGSPLLARLGLVSIAISPSLYAHGFMVTLPALFELRALALWAALAFMAAPLGPAWLLAPAIVVASWCVPGLGRHASEEDRLHPLADEREPWPGAPSQVPDGSGIGGLGQS